MATLHKDADRVLEVASLGAKGGKYRPRAYDTVQGEVGRWGEKRFARAVSLLEVQGRAMSWYTSPLGGYRVICRLTMGVPLPSEHALRGDEGAIVEAIQSGRQDVGSGIGADRALAAVERLITCGLVREEGGSLVLTGAYTNLGIDTAK